MAISEQQLDAWTAQGAVKGSRDTYATLRLALESEEAAYAEKDYTIFLQGSYGNDTNIFAESDVDIVIQLNSTFYSDKSQLVESERQALERTLSAATYDYDDFKQEVIARLKDRFGDAVTQGEKAINIAAAPGRRIADVVVACEFRRYFRFRGAYDEQYVRGICLFARSDGRRIENFPRQHSENCTAKHQATNLRFKPTVRLFKNLRSRLVNEGKLEGETAPSYYIEGLLHNAPNNLFVANLTDRFVNIADWMIKAEGSSEWTCANEQYYLLRSGSDVTWTAGKFAQFREAVVAEWNE